MQHLYFLGIAGQTMSGLAIASKQAGFKVSGVDGNAYPPSTDSLDAAGIHYYSAYDPEHIEDDMVIVLGNSIKKDNVELKEAIKRKLSIVSFPQLIEQLSAKQHRIVVVGTHGKTTTTTLIGWLLETAGQRPDVITGMSSKYFDGSVRLKGSSKVVIEGDEYSSSALDGASKFLYYHPDVLVMTSLEFDHPDIFKDFTQVKAAFSHLLDDLDKKSTIVAYGDDPEITTLLEGRKQKVITYGLTSECDWQAKNIHFGERETSFEVYVQGKLKARWTTPLAGEHNVKNALAALIVAELEDVSVSDAAEGLLQFSGAARRFELVANINDIVLIDDYAHHPTEVSATLAAAKARYPERKIWAMFKPHTYSRTSSFLKEFAASLYHHADVVLLSEVDAAREAGSEEVVSAADMAEHINQLGQKTQYIVDNDDAERLLVENVQPGDVIVFMYVSGLKGVIEGVTRQLQAKWES